MGESLPSQISNDKIWIRARLFDLLPRMRSADRQGL